MASPTPRVAGYQAIARRTVDDEEENAWNGRKQKRVQFLPRHGKKWPVVWIVVGIMVAASLCVYFSVPSWSLKISVATLPVAQEIATNTTTFAQLAKTMIPSYFEASVKTLDLFTSNVKPENVHDERKVLLKTRDLLDVCSPVYDNATTEWEDLRGLLSTGYEVVGAFQDLYASGVVYAGDLLEERRRAVLEWKTAFQQFLKDHNLDVFLRNPSDGCFYHRASHLFWIETTERPCGSDTATSALQFLGVLQLQHALGYLHTIMKYQSVLSVSKQEDYHNLRKELRSVLDEHEVFGRVMFPRHEQQVALDTLEQTREMLGELNDDWTAYDIYKHEGEEAGHKQQKLAERIDEEWDEFKSWATEHDLEGAIQSLVDSMGGSREPTRAPHVPDVPNDNSSPSLVPPKRQSPPEDDDFTSASEDKEQAHADDSAASMPHLQTNDGNDDGSRVAEDHKTTRGKNDDDAAVAPKHKPASDDSAHLSKATRGGDDDGAVVPKHKSTEDDDDTTTQPHLPSTDRSKAHANKEAKKDQFKH